MRSGFIWDDEAHVTAAPLRSWSGLSRIWTEVGATQQYYPFLHSVFWLEHRLWGDAPLGYHLANILWHTLAAILLAALLRRLEIRGAWLAALLFAVHPVHVESVAWISEQKNTLSAVFGLGAALTYLRFDADRSRTAYVLASVCFVAGLLTKTTIALLPAALLVLFWWRRGSVAWRRDGLPLAPWIVLGAAAGLFTAWVERQIIGAEGAAFDLTWTERWHLAGRVPWFYLGKLLWPANLTFVYSRWPLDSGTVGHWFPLAAAFAVLVVSWRIRHRSRTPLAVLLLFGGLLFPVLGFLNVFPFQYSFVADHFQYVASIPVLTALAAALAQARRIRPGGCPNWRWLAAGLIVSGLGVITALQARDYHDNRTLFRATVARNPGAWMAWNNLGKELMTTRAELPAAIRCFTHALELRSDYFEAHNNLGLALSQIGRPAEAIPHLESALRLKPRSFQAQNNLGIALASSGRPAEALRAFATAAALNPRLPNIHDNWGKALRLLGRDAEAEQHFRIAAELRASAGR